ncbi:CobW family GTP-binding protein [Paenibacillus hodogayensis]|uniref:CobW family GTP-binding protein n=1 Tax=Paenibacillus hodogayensis TaxID=279208 RepID=A0ABV5VZE8_9BACL
MSIPVTVLSGFLGSGKTTLLLRLLEETARRGLRPGVLMNELGRLDVDGSILEAHSRASVQKLLDGCVCCSKKGELLGALQTLVEQQPDLILIELTGVANPEEIAETITEPELLGHVRLRQVITVLDAEHVLDYNSIFAADKQLVRTLRRQIEVADLLVLNKTDLAPSAKLGKIESTLRKYNERSRIVRTTHSRLEWDPLFAESEGEPAALRQPEPVAAPSGFRASLLGSLALGRQKPPRSTHDAEASRPGNGPVRSGGRLTDRLPASPQQRSYSRIQTVSLPWNGSARASRAKVEGFLRSREDQLLRAKGYMRFPGDSAVYLMQYAGKRTVWERVRYEGQSYVVLIGIDLDGELLAEQWNRTFD